ncbi:hypothetical protein [Cryobacterium sp. Hz9]|uniref:hypothetical protein n=1 Tax=Cryobacterium sp. Hz9 TaxID=1259167 RepID=UPI00141BA4F8|nr:hypothetical protein [Cryobacterium sp. Hz9]
MQESIARVPTNRVALEDIRGAAYIVRLRIATSIPAISAAEFDLISRSLGNHHCQEARFADTLRRKRACVRKMPMHLAEGHVSPLSH